jgi:hypothetical protein
MSYSYTPTATDAAVVATDAATRIGNITGTPTLSSPIVPAAFQAFVQATADNMLNAVGLQLESNNALTANNTTSTSFVDIPGTSITFTAPIAKTYLVHCDFSMFQSANPAAVHQVRLVVNGNNGPAIWNAPVALNQQSPMHLMHAAACAAGSNTIKLQWAASSGCTINVNTNSYANYMVGG